MTIDVVNDDVVMEALQAMPSRVAKAAVRAMNRAIASGRTVMVREVARDTGLKSSAVREAMPVRNATAGQPEATIRTSLRRIPLSQFRARGPEPSRGRGRGVSYRLPGGSGGRVPNAFIATMASKHRGVFKRSTEKFMRVQQPGWKQKRPAIIELFGPSLGHVFEQHRPLGIARLKEAFHTNFDHELSRLVPELSRRESLASKALDG